MQKEHELMEAWPAMVRVCRTVLGNRDDAEDCAAEAIVAVLQDDRHTSATSIEAFMVTVARRRAVDFVRRRASERRRDTRLAGFAEARGVDIAEAVADQAEARWLANEALTSLTPGAHAVLAQLADGATVVETARRLGLSRRSVESHLLRARRALRQAIGAMLALLGWILGGVRRSSAPITAVAAAVAVVAAVTVTAAPPAPASEAGTTTTAGTRLVRVEPGAAHEREQSRVAPPPPKVDDRPAAAPPARPVPPQPAAQVARVVTPAVQADVTSRSSEERGVQISDVTHCVEQLEVSLEHVGC